MHITRTTLLIALAGFCTPMASAQFCNFDEPVLYLLQQGGDGISPSYIDAGDIDNDGDIDLITDSNGPGNDPTQILWNDGTGNFTMGPILTSGWGFGEVALGDMDDDGDLDVLRCNSFSNGVYFFRNTGGGAFDLGIYYSGGGGCQAVKFVDFDNDGDLDFITIDKFGQQVRPYRNINGLGFTSVGLFNAGGQPNALDTGDVDNDGDQDVIVAHDDLQTVSVLYNAGDGTYPNRQSFAVGVDPTDVILADLNGDGNLDAVSANWDDLIQFGNTVSVLIGDGSGGFAPEQRYATGVTPRQVRASDLNGDGFIDLAVACQVGDVISLLPGQGDGTFGDAQTLDYGTNPIALTIADFDADGGDDIAYLDNTFSRLYTLGNDCDTPIDPSGLVVNWQVGYDNFFNIDRGNHIVVNDVNETYVGGDTSFNDNEQDFLLVKFDADGNLLWQRSYNGAGDHYDHAEFLGLDRDGNVFIAGQSWGAGLSVQWAVVKYDPDGNQLWVRRYDGGNPNAQQYPRGFAVGPNGEFAMTGWVRDVSFSNIYFAVVCYDAMGNQMFDVSFPSAHSGSAGAQGEAVTFDAAGSIIATGFGNDDDEFGEEMITAKIDPSGVVLWENRLDLTNDQSVNETLGQAITTDASGNVFVATQVSSGGFNDRDAALVMYASDGSHIGTVFDEQPGNAYPHHFTWIGETQLLLTSSTTGGVQATSFDPAGAINWSRTVEASASSTNEGGHVAFGLDGFLYFIDSGGGDIAVERWSTNGLFQSRTRFDTGAAIESARAIAVAPNGNLRVAGSYEPTILSRSDVLLYDLVARSISTCPPDLNGDGNLDFFDVSTFLNAFNAGDALADLTGDGSLDFFDVSAFLNMFNAGCP